MTEEEHNIVERPFIAVDVFAGGGGASLGIEWASGASPIVAINHNPAAIRMHEANHPSCIHYEESVWTATPREVCGLRPVDLAWFSPDCTHFSRAKGSAPRSKEIRSLAWVVIDWARQVRPRVICLENVPEFLGWGPLDDSSQPIKARVGETFREWLGQLDAAGFPARWGVLNAADFGAPTARRRLVLTARSDGQPNGWPEPSHGPGRALPWRTAAECIDWDIPVPSIFTRARPLAEATLRRIAEGVRRYVIESASPFLLCLTHGGRLEPLSEPMRTITTANRGERALIVPSIVRTDNTSDGRLRGLAGMDEPLRTITSAGGHGLVAAFLAKHYGGPRPSTGQSLDRPLGTVTGIDHHAVVAAWLEKMHGSARAGQAIDRPAPTITSGGGRGGGHAALCAAFLLKYYGQGGQWSGLNEPVHTLVSKARMGLVTVEIAGEPWALVDIGMRMLQPRELARAQGFPDSYILTGNKSEQVARIGNSVCPPLAEAVVRAQFPELVARVA